MHVSPRLLLGSVAVHYEGKLMYDANKGIITNNDDASKCVRPTFRKGWELKARSSRVTIALA